MVAPDACSTIGHRTGVPALTHVPPHTLSDARSGLLALKRGGWTLGHILHAPPQDLTAWLRDNGRDDAADAIDSGGAAVVEHVRYWAVRLYES